MLEQKTKFKEKLIHKRKERNYYEALNEEVVGLEDKGEEMLESKVSKINKRSSNDKVLQVKGVNVNKLSIDEMTNDAIDSETCYFEEEHRKKFSKMIEQCDDSFENRLLASEALLLDNESDFKVDDSAKFNYDDYISINYGN